MLQRGLFRDFTGPMLLFHGDSDSGQPFDLLDGTTRNDLVPYGDGLRDRPAAGCKYLLYL